MQGRLALQWRPTNSVEITLNDNFARDNNSQNQYGFSVWFNQGNLQNIVLDKNGTASSYDQPGTPTDFQGQVNGEVLQHNDFGANVKWNVNDKLTVTFDADHAEGWLNPNKQYGAIDVDVGYGGPWATDLGIVVPSGSGLPYPTTFGPAGDASKFINNGIIGSHVVPIGTNVNLDTINQAKVQGDWSENDNLNFAVRLPVPRRAQKRVGLRYVREQQLAGLFRLRPGVRIPRPASRCRRTSSRKSFSTSDFINGWSNRQPAAGHPGLQPLSGAQLPAEPQRRGCERLLRSQWIWRCWPAIRRHLSVGVQPGFLSSTRRDHLCGLRELDLQDGSRAHAVEDQRRHPLRAHG